MLAQISAAKWCYKSTVRYKDNALACIEAVCSSIFISKATSAGTCIEIWPNIIWMGKRTRPKHNHKFKSQSLFADDISWRLHSLGAKRKQSCLQWSRSWEALQLQRDIHYVYYTCVPIYTSQPSIWSSSNDVESVWCFIIICQRIAWTFENINDIFKHWKCKQPVSLLVVLNLCYVINQMRTMNRN